MTETLFRCTHYTKTEKGKIYKSWTRCEEPAAVHLLDGDGKPVPGGLYCEKHATEIVDEYREKLGETWTIVEAGA